MIPTLNGFTRIAFQIGKIQISKGNWQVVWSKSPISNKTNGPLVPSVKGPAVDFSYGNLVPVEGDREESRAGYSPIQPILPVCESTTPPTTLMVPLRMLPDTD